MKKSRTVFLVVFVATLFCWATASGAEKTTEGPNTQTNRESAERLTPESGPEQVRSSQPQSGQSDGLSPVVAAVIKMAEAGVSPEVVRTYVESSSLEDPLTGAEIIALKQQQVPDEITTALIKQGARAKDRELQLKEAVARALAARNAEYGGMDPESYEYFRYHYLHPRTVASVYQRLPPYYGPRVRSWHGPARHGYPTVSRIY